MVRLTEQIGEKGPLLAKKRSVLSEFCYENGYRLSVTDLGNEGVKIELVHEYKDGGAIKYLLQTIRQIKYSPLKELANILQRLMREKSLGQILQRGEKKKIREAVRLLKIQQS
jgi:hypothetical protein